MTTGRNKWSRFRPRFSLRTLFVFVTLVCAYFGAWEATKRHCLSIIHNDPIVIGKVPVETQSFVRGANSPAALIVACDEWDLGPSGRSWHRRYYLWLFGPMFRLPFEGTVDRATQDGLWFF